MSRIISIFILVLILLSPSGLWAQTLPIDIDISINPAEPKPGQQVSATLQSFGMDLNSANISWFYNGAPLSSGVGKKSTDFIAPTSNTLAGLSVTATGAEGTAQSSITVRSASIDVIWEAVDSYVPPFYKGKALAPIGGKIRAVAVPSITAPRSISYSWFYNNSAVPGQSGTNRNSLNIKTDVLSDIESISVSAVSGSFTGSGSIKIPLRNPEILIYQKSNGFIDYTKGSIRDVFVTEPGVTLRAEPFNFSIAGNVEKSLSIGFLLGEEPFVGSTNVQELSITRPETSGESSIEVNITSIKERLQILKRRFTLHF